MRRLAGIRVGALLFALAAVAYSANLREISAQDTLPNRLLPVAVIEYGTVTLDPFLGDPTPGARRPYWAVEAGGHYHSVYPLLPGLLAVPVYLVPVLMGVKLSWPLVDLLAKLSATLIAALSVTIVHGVARRLASPSTALLVAVVYAFGTSTWSISSQGLWSHGPAQLFLALAIAAAVSGRDWACGLAAGLMVACRLPTLPMAGALLVHGFARGLGRGLTGGVVAAAVGAVVVAYNLLTFGTLQGGYAHLNTNHLALVGIEGLWSTPLAEGLAGLLLSPSRGLWIYSPVLLFAALGVGLIPRDPRRGLLACLAGGIAVSVLLLAKYTVWWAGHSFGPRYLTDLLPALVLFLAPVHERLLTRSGLLGTVFAALFAVSVAVQLVGVLYYPSPRAVDWNTSPRNVDFAHERLWNWRDSQLERLLRNGPRPPGFGGETSQAKG